VLKNNNKREVFAKYVGNDKIVYLNTSIWVSKILVTNMQAPKIFGDLNQGTNSFADILLWWVKLGA
jgi:hypothetical protein